MLAIQHLKRLSRKSVFLLAVVCLGCAASQVPNTSETAPRVHLPRAIAQLTQPTTALQDISENSVNQAINVEGQVQQHAPLVEGWLYQVADDTATIWITTAIAPPAIGESVRIRGVVQYQQILIGDADIGEYYLQEAAREVRDPAEEAGDEAESDEGGVEE